MRIFPILLFVFLMLMPSFSYALVAPMCPACDPAAPYDLSRLGARIVNFHVMYRLWIYALSVLLVMARYWYCKAVRKDKEKQPRDYLFFAALLPVIFILIGELLGKTVGTSWGGRPCAKFCTPLPQLADIAEDLLLWIFYCVTGRSIFHQLAKLPKRYAKQISFAIAFLLSAVIVITLI